MRAEIPIPVELGPDGSVNSIYTEKIIDKSRDYYSFPIHFRLSCRVLFPSWRRENHNDFITHKKIIHLFFSGSNLCMACFRSAEQRTAAGFILLRAIRLLHEFSLSRFSVNRIGFCHRSVCGVTQTGSGVKVGVICPGVRGWETSKASGDLPASFSINNVSGFNASISASVEGTAMMEIIHDIVALMRNCTVQFQIIIRILLTQPTGWSVRV